MRELLTDQRNPFLVFLKCLIINLGLHSPLSYLFVSFGHVNYQNFLIVK